MKALRALETSRNTSWHDIRTQQAWVFISAAVKSSNLAKNLECISSLWTSCSSHQAPGWWRTWVRFYSPLRNILGRPSHIKDCQHYAHPKPQIQFGHDRSHTRTQNYVPLWRLLPEPVQDIVRYVQQVIEWPKCTKAKTSGNVFNNECEVTFAPVSVLVFLADCLRR